MIFTETKLAGAFIIDLNKLEDDRGFFARAFCTKELEEHNLITDVKQANMSSNKKARTLRGLHYQLDPYQETKLVRCTRGSLYDVIIDLRKNSPTFGQWTGVELTAENHRALFVPRDFAHGFVTHEDNTEAFYLASQSYVPGAESGIRWDDPRFAIDWPMTPIHVSEKDASWEDYKG